MAELKGMPRPYAELATSTRDVTKCRETGLQRPPDHLLWPVFPLVNPAHSYVWSAQSGSVGGFIAAQTVGAALAYLLFRWLLRR